MFDTMTLTKLVGGFCGALLVFLLGGWAAETLYHTGGGHYGEAEQAYVIDTGEGGGDAEPEEELDFATVMASADAGAGERVWGKCRACHKLEDGANGTGPHLYDVVGRPVGGVDGFNYSGALSAVADVWSPEHLNAFLEDPRGYAPGTSMGFAGLPKVEDRANLIAYLDTIGS
ncbi:cytochrome c family protein [Rhodobacteraceae bacterium CCMM004]|nr:cytochrome c family protein [Rhodobacteraceae bacterium CCMM004]